MKLREWVFLPRAISPFERRYLSRANDIGLVFFFLHLPVLVAIAWVNDTGPGAAAVLTALVLFGPLGAHSGLSNARHISVVYGIAAMALGGLLVHFGQGPLQIEMHFYFLVLIALLAIYGNPAVIVAATLSVVTHHAVCWAIAPDSVFGSAAPLETIAVHATFVLVDAVGACFMARTFFDNVIDLERIVAARTEELATKERNLQTILDHVERGFGIIGSDGLLSSGRSAALDRWFGPPDATTPTIFDLLARWDGDFAARSRKAWHEVETEFLPLQETLAQMPRELSRDTRSYEVTYAPIDATPGQRAFLVIVADVTETRAQMAELDRTELVRVLERLVANPAAFFEFCDEIAALIITVRDRNLPASERQLSLGALEQKARRFGLGSIAQLCDELGAVSSKASRLRRSGAGSSIAGPTSSR